MNVTRIADNRGSLVDYYYSEQFDTQELWRCLDDEFYKL